MTIKSKSAIWLLLPATCLFSCTWFIAGCASSRPAAEAPDDALSAASRDESIADYERRREEAQLAAAKAQLEKGDAEGALMLVDHWLEKPPHDPAARQFLADLLVEQGQQKRAEELLHRELAESPHKPKQRRSLGRILKFGNSSNSERPMRAAAHSDRDDAEFRMSSQEEPAKLPEAPLPTALP